MKPMDCAQISLAAEAGTDRVLLELTGTAGEQVRAELSPAHLSTLHQQIHAAFAARNPAPKPAETPAAAAKPAGPA